LTTLTLDAAELHRVLDLAPGAPLSERWALDRILPHHEGGVLLSFREQSGGRLRIGLQLRCRQDAAPAWRRTTHLDLITHIPEGVDAQSTLAALEPLAVRVAQVDAKSTQVTDPLASAPAPPRPRRLHLPERWRSGAPTPYDFGRVFVVDLPSDCGLDCSFCATRLKYSPVTRFEPAQGQRLHDRLAEAFQEGGYEVVRFSGLDPLHHPETIPLIRHAVDLGYQHVHIYSPCTRLGEPDYLDALLDVLPREAYTLHIPVYGGDAATHDGVVGKGGAFAQVIAGLDALAGMDLLDRVLLLTVITVDNLAELPAMRRLFAEYGCPVQVFLPFPTTLDPADPFYQVAASHSEMVGPMTTCDPPLGVWELLPCVRWRHERDTGEPALSRGGFNAVIANMGNLFQLADYRRVDDPDGGSRFHVPTVRCPDSAQCALTDFCPGAVYHAYAERFGLSELQAVSAAELTDLGFSLPSTGEMT
jgi:hypothetical protein